MYECNTYMFFLNASILFDLRGEMEMDAEYFKTGVALKTMSHMETPLSMTASADLQKAKFFTKFDVEKLVNFIVTSIILFVFFQMLNV